jgi:multidrug efflux pump subunit AcrB
VLVGGLSVGTLLTLFVIPGLYLYVKSAMGNKS